MPFTRKECLHESEKFSRRRKKVRSQHNHNPNDNSDYAPRVLKYFKKSKMALYDLRFIFFLTNVKMLMYHDQFPEKFRALE